MARGRKCLLPPAGQVRSGCKGRAIMRKGESTLEARAGARGKHVQGGGPWPVAGLQCRSCGRKRALPSPPILHK